MATYEMHGVGIAVRADTPEVADGLDSRLAPFATTGRPPRPTLAFELVGLPSLPEPVDPAAGRPVYDSELGDVTYLDDRDRLLVHCPGLAQLDASLSDGGVTIRYVAGHEDAVDLAVHPLFTLALIELLKRHGRYSLHASCVARDSAGALFAAPSGSGKTTLSLALARAGWSFVADDMVFLRETTTAEGAGAAVEILGFPDEVDLTPDTVTRFTELDALAALPTRGLRDKHHVRIESVLATTPLLRCRAAHLFFPQLAGGARGTTVEPMSRAEALHELLPNVLLTEQRSSQRHLDALAALSSTTPCARLLVGTDLDAAVEVVSALVLGEATP